ncbi:Hypothetical protein FKW44_012874 [Caligus rogercresseyi]|uniref:Uncharacterized protein n=1 Tax=Caligus rogercresseyi TaxID=217165 RepID=A0A7T8HK00_CALRO|nr:Hypothetical protein FKW44_012874 [Caligus rogercresseyi]
MPLDVGKETCPHNCKRVHLPLCSKVVCYGNTYARKECSMWHGHIRAAARVERKREREEEQKRQFRLGSSRKSLPRGNGGARGTFSPQNKPKKYQEPGKWENLPLRSEIALLRSKQQQKSIQMTTPSILTQISRRLCHGPPCCNLPYCASKRCRPSWTNRQANGGPGSKSPRLKVCTWNVAGLSGTKSSTSPACSTNRSSTRS